VSHLVAISPSKIDDKMKLGAKSLTVALVLVLIIVPAVALASCSQAMSGMSDSEMVGMVMPPPDTSVSERRPMLVAAYLHQPR